MPRYLIFPLVALTQGFLITSAEAQTSCEFFSDDNWNGSRVIYNLPDGNLAGQPWSNQSRRFDGANLSQYARAIYKNVESVRITAGDSDVSLYVFDGEDYNGRFQVVRAAQGDTARWRFGSMANKVRSVVCQRDVFDAPSIPTSLIADAMTARIHDAVSEQRHRFYNHRIDIRQGRLSWENGHELCRSNNCAQIDQPDRRKYWDFLRYSYKSRGRLKADGREYTISIEIWIEPFVHDRRLRFRVDAWDVSVTDWIWERRLRDSVRNRLRDEIPAIGAMLEAEIRDRVRDSQGTVAASLLDNLRGISLTYSCDSDTDRVGYPNYNYTAFQIERICGGTTPDNVVAPSIRVRF
ncbi:hypothetical protein [uncultured Roseovarius sp.]|uniref:hypothetical protein n=1 Tax=uncultured Roseovarius sp. TaxID=293344 RepID=UPI002606DD44|nr:hypothetical protein [uncultured Roseovarius sp.]